MFLCSLERKFPGKFKTHPTFISSPLPKAQNIIYKRIPLFRGKPCSSLKMASYQLKCINYQMDHIWLAPGRLKNSPGVLIGSQCSRTLYRSFIVTLYVQCPKYLGIKFPRRHNHLQNILQNEGQADQNRLVLGSSVFCIMPQSLNIKLVKILYNSHSSVGSIECLLTGGAFT